ncbi:MAG TPA: D-aminopeptidase [Caulobacteraceae bacterium]|jgi:D-aminopeptidase|nr:D-aminopeptidase [Caulobacteraceae bacterium]
MTDDLSARLDRAAARIARDFPGPGGACAVLKDGEVLVRHAWGYANAERRIAFTPKSLFRICSITKQFTCASVLAAFPDPTALDDAIRARLPKLKGPAPGALALAHNQSGLRDYWAVAMLHGSPVEAPFADIEAAKVVAGTRSLQFAPRTRYSYCNQNFRILGDALAERTGRSFAEHLRTSVFGPAGMESALLAADTRALPDGTDGYEGSQATGFRAAENRIIWTGDAGIAASLEDMIAYERWLDASRDDPDALYSRLSAPVSFENGAEATYGFGLSRSVDFDRRVTGHGGALRGWRSHRLYSPADRISVVVMFNHLSDARASAMNLLAAALDAKAPSHRSDAPAPDWLGAWVDPETRLSVRLDSPEPGRVRLRFGHWPEVLDLQADGSAVGPGGTRLVREGDGLRMERAAENQSTVLVRCAEGQATDVAGVFRCAELDAELTVTDAGGALFGGFSGFLGQGRMEQLEPIARDVWALPCWRALDHTPPGDWTVAFERDERGQVARAIVGCWLARGLVYERV